MEETQGRPLSLPVRIVGVLVASLLVLPVVLGLIVNASGNLDGGLIAALGFIVFFGGIILVLVAVRKRADAQRQHDRQWGPRPRPPG